MTTLSKYLTLLRQEVRSGCSTPHTGSPQSTLESTTADCREELLRDKLWAKADRDMIHVRSCRQPKARPGSRLRPGHTHEHGHGHVLSLVDSAMWERHAHEAESHGNTIGHSPRHVPPFSLSLSLSLSLTVFHCPSSHFRPAATALLRCFCVSPHPSTVHLHSTDAQCIYCTILYCMKHEA